MEQFKVCAAQGVVDIMSETERFKVSRNFSFASRPHTLHYSTVCVE